MLCLIHFSLGAQSLQTQAMLDNLGSEWVAFQQAIIDADIMLKKNKEKFKTGLLSQAEEFRKRVGALSSDFAQKGPFSSSITSADAIEIIEQFKLVSMSIQHVCVELSLLRICVLFRPI